MPIPKAYLCPISNKPMFDPVIADDGYSYDRRSLEPLFSGFHADYIGIASPKTGKTIYRCSLRPNLTLRELIVSAYEEALAAGNLSREWENFIPVSGSEEAIRSVSFDDSSSSASERSIRASSVRSTLYAPQGRKIQKLVIDCGIFGGEKLREVIRSSGGVVLPDPINPYGMVVTHIELDYERVFAWLRSLPLSCGNLTLKMEERDMSETIRNVEGESHNLRTFTYALKAVKQREESEAMRCEHR